MTKEDYKTICRDFGGIFNTGDESKNEKYWPDCRKIFTFGGASSHDIEGGILETDDPEYKKKKKEPQGLY